MSKSRLIENIANLVKDKLIDASFLNVMEQSIKSTTNECLLSRRSNKQNSPLRNWRKVVTFNFSIYDRKSKKTFLLP